jgi:hypothetical protein
MTLYNVFIEHNNFNFNEGDQIWYIFVTSFNKLIRKDINVNEDDRHHFDSCTIVCVSQPLLTHNITILIHVL